jgi:hypothetical protein
MRRRDKETGDTRGVMNGQNAYRDRIGSDSTFILSSILSLSHLSGKEDRCLCLTEMEA